MKEKMPDVLGHFSLKKKIFVLLFISEKTADISRRHHSFPCEMTSEQRAQKFYTDVVHCPELGNGSDWSCCERNLL